MTTFRDKAWELSSPRLRTTTAAKLVYAFIGLPLDMIAEAAKQAVYARFPSFCPDDALAYHARDRGIRRGPNEPAPGFRSRLLLWREIWKGAGVGRVLLDEIAGYLTPSAIRMRIWTQIGVVYTREADGTFRVERVSSTLWNWDGRTDLWARFWPVLYSTGPSAPWARDGVWTGTETWGDDGTTWGSTASPSQVQTIRAIVSERKPAAAVVPKIIVAFDDAAFDPSDTAPPLPDGTWAHSSKTVAGVVVPARDARAIYWQGVA